MNENLDRAAIIATLKREALNDPETGWLSDLSRRGLEWDDFNEEIMIQCGDGSVDVSHLAEIVEHLIETATKPLLRRVEAAEREAKAAKGVLAQSIAERALDTHHAAGIAVDEAVKAVVKVIVEDPSRRAREAEARAEAAEAAVARVREVATAMANHSLPEAPRGGAWETAHGAQLFAKDILDALDGGEQE